MFILLHVTPLPWDKKNYAEVVKSIEDNRRYAEGVLVKKDTLRDLLASFLK